MTVPVTLFSLLGEGEEGVEIAPALHQLVKAAALEDAATLESQDEVAAPEQAARYRDALALPAGEGGAVLAAKGQRAALRNERREAGELYGPGDLLLREGAEHG